MESDPIVHQWLRPDYHTQAEFPGFSIRSVILDQRLIIRQFETVVGVTVTLGYKWTAVPQTLIPAVRANRAQSYHKIRESTQET